MIKYTPYYSYYELLSGDRLYIGPTFWFPEDIELYERWLDRYYAYQDYNLEDFIAYVSPDVMVRILPKLGYKVRYLLLPSSKVFWYIPEYVLTGCN